jgi:hypothetical protein
MQLRKRRLITQELETVTLYFKMQHLGKGNAELSGGTR